jgi:hypothetical protein
MKRLGGDPSDEDVEERGGIRRGGTPMAREWSLDIEFPEPRVRRNC